jgi:predicted dehydrogenase
MNFKIILLGTNHPHIFHRIEYLRQNRITVLGYHDSDFTVSSRMQEYVDCPRYTDCEQLLSLEFDIAMIHGHDNENPEYVRLAIDHGAKGIFLEKPGAAHPHQFGSFASEIRERKLVFEVGWELHYLETVEFARDVLKQSLLGRITEARFHGGCPGGAGAEPWQSDDRNIGGFFYSLGGHVVETVVDLFGLPNQVISSIRKLPAQTPHIGYSWVPGLFEGKQLNPEVAIGTLVHEDIASAILEYDTMNIHLDFTAWEASRYLDDWTMDLYGTQGSLHLNFDVPGGCLMMKDAQEGWNVGRNQIFPEIAHQKGDMLKSAFEKQMDCFFQRVLDPNCDVARCAEETAQGLLILFHALYESARTRSWIELKK